MACVTNFTIAVWVNWDGGAAWQRIFDFGNDTKQNMFLILSSGRGTLRFAITTNGAGAEQILEAAALPPGQWQHVAITRDGKCVPPLQERCPRRVGRCDDNARQLQPGAKLSRRNPVCADPLFGGRLDELFIYNYALSGNEIARLAANEPPVLGGLQIPGDGNQDSSLDISDAVRLLGFLFGASSPPALGTACILIEGCQDRCAP